MCTYLIIISIILIMGLFGGIINYYTIVQTDTTTTTGGQTDASVANKYLLPKSLCTGVAAAILVPLFLNTISSGVLENILGASDKVDAKNYFIFSGFCLIAAIASKRFIDDLYDKVIKIGKTATDAKKTAVDAKETADSASSATKELEDTITEPSETSRSAFPETAEVADTDDDNTKAVLKAFSDSNYTYRTLKGLAKQSGLPDQTVIDILNVLKTKGRVKSKPNRNNNDVWKVIY